jgi:hypothetical protein
MIPATALTSQQNPSSQHKTEFPSGTRPVRPGRAAAHWNERGECPRGLPTAGPRPVRY